MKKATKLSKYSCWIISALLFIGIFIPKGHHDNIRAIDAEGNVYDETTSIGAAIGEIILIIQIAVYGFSIMALLLSIIQTLLIKHKLKQTKKADNQKGLNDKNDLEEQYQIKKDSLKYYIILFAIVSVLNAFGQIIKCFN